MTNKINGIDVSECEYINCCSEDAKCIILQDDICSNSQYCKSEPDCYFKQLKRLQEENRSLQMLSCANCGEKYLSPDGAELYEKNVQLQQENEELKARLKTLDDEILTIEITPDEFERHKKYKQALEEIREITEQDRNCMNSELACCRLCDKLDLIKEKTNEVLK